MNTDPTRWVKASASGSNGQCVELRRNGDLVQIRDSKNPEGPILTRITPSSLAAWLEVAKDGDLDHLV